MAVDFSPCIFWRIEWGIIKDEAISQKVVDVLYDKVNTEELIRHCRQGFALYSHEYWQDLQACAAGLLQHAHFKAFSWPTSPFSLTTQWTI